MPLKPETVVAVAELAATHETQLAARAELRRLAKENDEFDYAVRVAFRAERLRLDRRVP